MRRLIPIVLMLLLVAVPSGGAAPQKRTILLGVLGNPAHFEQHTGQTTQVRHVIMGFGQNTGRRLDRMLADMAPIPMLGFGMKGITSQQIAQGKGDAFLVDLNRAVAEFPGNRIYIRPWGEMNGHWNVYCAFNRDGSSRGPAYSTANFKKAFARAYLIVHGDPNVNQKLRKLGMPPVNAELRPAPFPRVRFVWNPQGFGAPNIPANSAAAYYPGDAYVDVVGNDLYNQGGRAAWEAAAALYERYKHKPHAFPEWANWGLDDPAFVKRMADFVRARPKVELIAWFNGQRGSVFDIARQPRSKAAYRQHITPLGR